MNTKRLGQQNIKTQMQFVGKIGVCYILLPKSFYTSKSIICFSMSFSAFIFMTPFPGNYGKRPR